MTLAELKKIIDQELEDFPEKAKVPVAVAVAETSMGPTASTGVKFAGVGIDWDAYAFYIHPATPLIRKSSVM